MLESDFQKAEKLALEIFEEYQQTSLVYQVLGSVRLAQEDAKAARENWLKALELSSDQIEIEMVQEWIENTGEV